MRERGETLGRAKSLRCFYVVIMCNFAGLNWMEFHGIGGDCDYLLI